MSIRPAQPRDAAEIALLHVRTWQAAYRDQLPDAYLRSLDGELDQRTARVGFVTFGPSEDTPIDPRVGQVYAIYVDSAKWGSGYGRDLFAAAVRGLADAGFVTATLWVLDTNARARRFYEAAGWVTDGAIKTEQRGDIELHEVRYRSAPLVRATAR